MKINYTSSGINTNKPTIDSWVCKPSKDGSLTCTKNLDSASTYHPSSNNNSSWQNFTYKPFLSTAYASLASFQKIDLSSTKTNNKTDELIREIHEGEQKKPSESARITHEICSLNMVLNKDMFDGLDFPYGNKSLEELKNILEQKSSLVEELKSSTNQQPKLTDITSEKQLSPLPVLEPESQYVPIPKLAQPIIEQQKIVNTTVSTEKEQFNYPPRLKPAGPLPVTEMLENSKIELDAQIKKQHSNMIDVYKKMKSISRLAKNDLIKNTLDDQLHSLVDKFAKSNPKYQKLLSNTDFPVLKQELVKIVQNNQKQENRTGVFFVNELLGISSANATPVLGIALVAEEIVALGGTTLVSAIVANKAIEDYSKYQELEDKFNEPKVLSTPINEQTVTKETFPDHSEKYLPLPGFSPIQTKAPTAETFPVHEQDWQDLILYKSDPEFDNYIKNIQPGNRVDNTKIYYQDAPYHHKNSTGNIKSKAPSDPLSALQNSFKIKDTSKLLIGVDTKNKEIVIFDCTIGNEYHGHVVEWEDLREIERNILVKNGLADIKKGIK